MLSWCLVEVTLLDHLVGILFWKGYSILSKSVKNNGAVGQYTFLDFANVRGYLTFKGSAWKRDYKISFEQKMPVFLDPILEISYNVLSGKAKILQTTCIMFRDPWNFP